MAQEDNCAVTISEAELDRIAAEATTQVFQKEQLDLEISTIMADFLSPTKEDREERRENNLLLELDDSSNDAADVTPKKSYSIFDKPTRKSPRRALKEVANNSTTKENKTNIRSKNKKLLDDDQMIIDAGQKNLTDLKTCPECDFVYNPGSKQDEESHNKNHFVAQKGR